MVSDMELYRNTNSADKVQGGSAVTESVDSAHRIESKGLVIPKLRLSCLSQRGRDLNFSIVCYFDRGGLMIRTLLRVIEIELVC